MKLNDREQAGLVDLVNALNDARQQYSDVAVPEAPNVITALAAADDLEHTAYELHHYLSQKLTRVDHDN